MIDYKADSDLKIIVKKTDLEIELEKKKYDASLDNEENYNIKKLKRTTEFHTKHEDLIKQERNARFDTEDKEHNELLKRKKERSLKEAQIIAETSEEISKTPKVEEVATTLRNKLVAFAGVGYIQLTGFVAIGIIPILAVRYGYHYFIKKLNDPRIIIETSIGSWPYELSKKIFRFSPRKPKEQLENMILARETREQIAEIIAIILQNLKEGKPLGNILFTGHPGNGKTYLAKALAAVFGMDYIILTGSSFFQDNAGVKAIDQIFGKMTKGRKVIIFIDEMETLTAKRDGRNPDGDGYRLVNQLLNYTSEPSEDFILIGATNHSNLFDPAFYRRFQYVVEMPLPGYEERKKSLTLFRNKQLINKKNKERVMSIFSANVINDIAKKTEGLSFAELQTIIDYMRSSSRISKVGITKKIIDNAVSRVLNKEKTFNKTFIKK